MVYVQYKYILYAWGEVNSCESEFFCHDTSQADCERELLKLCANKHSDVSKIKHLLNEPAVDPNFYDEVFLEHFCWIIVQEFDCIKQCVHFRLQNGRSLVWWACNSGQTSIVAVVLDSGADANLQNYVREFTLRLQY